MKNLIKKLCIENIDKNPQNRIYSYYLEKNLKFNENQINKIFENPKFKDFTILFDFYRFKIELDIYSKDKEYYPNCTTNKIYYSIDLYLNQKNFEDLYIYIQKELKKTVKSKSNLDFSLSTILYFNKYELEYI